MIIALNPILNSNKISNKECLILLKNHAILNWLLLVEVVPRAIGAFFAITAIF